MQPAQNMWNQRSSPQSLCSHTANQRLSEGADYEISRDLVRADSSAPLRLVGFGDLR